MKMKMFNVTKNLVLASLIFLASCSKDSGGGSTTLSASNLAPGKAIMTFSYANASSGSFTSTEATSGAISNGTYSNVSCADASASGVKSVIFLPSDTWVQGSSYNIGTGTGINSFSLNLVSLAGQSQAWASNAGGSGAFNVTITRKAGKEVEGTFSGQLGTQLNATKVDITNGKFAYKLQ
jgi:hypothetical protein